MTETLGLTPSQTVGPYLSIGLLDGAVTASIVPADDPRAIVVRGRLLDGQGDPVPDGMIEFWQANEAGRYAHPADTRDDVPLEDGFWGFGRSGTVERRLVRDRDAEAGSGAGARRPSAGAAHRRRRLRARPAEAAGDPPLLP